MGALWDPNKPVLWKCWYVIDHEIKTFTGGSLSEFRALPDDGFQLMVLAFPDGTKRRISGCDYYWGDLGVGDRPLYGQSAPLQTLEDILHRYPNASVKLGRHTDDLSLIMIEREADLFEPYAIEITATAY